MERTKLTSIRLEKETSDYIDKMLEGERFYKRSDVINNILAAVTNNFTEKQVWDMVHRYKWWQNVVNVNFEPTGELKTTKRRD